MTFADRSDAGRRLAALLGHLAAERPVVLGVPRGGVVVAREVADALGAPLDVVVVRKVGAPGHPELAVGAVAEDGEGVLHAAVVGPDGTPDAAVARYVREARLEAARLTAALREGRPPEDLTGRTAVIVDDGLATGLTDLAAARAVRARGAARIVVAAPVGSPDAEALLRDVADEVVIALTPRRFGSVGRWYDAFGPVPDDVVAALLER